MTLIIEIPWLFKRRKRDRPIGFMPDLKSRKFLGIGIHWSI